MTKTRISCLVMITLMLCVSCSALKQSNAEQALEQTISNVEQKQNLAFQGQTEVQMEGKSLQQGFSFEGIIVNPDEMYMKRIALSPRLAANDEDQWVKMEAVRETDPRKNIFGDWNPITQLKLLKDVRKTVHAESDRTASNLRVLGVEINADDWKKVVINRWQSQINGFKATASISLSEQNPAETNQQTQEIQQSIQQAQQRLQAIAPTLVSKGSYRLVMDSTSQLPTEMTIETDLSYVEEGLAKVEKLRSSYTFKANDKNIMLPPTK